MRDFKTFLPLANRILKKVFRFLPSLKFAVINLIILGILSAIGTFLESYYDREFAQLVMYGSIWMKLALISLSVNVASVLVDRWPWKKRHASFVIAHFGILILVVGSWLTQVGGVDGSMRLEVGEEGRSVNLPSRILVVYSSFDGQNMSDTIFHEQTWFLLDPPTETDTYKIPLGQDFMEVIDFYPYALEDYKFKKHKNAGLAVQFLLEGERASYSDWIYKSRHNPFIKKEVGMASLVLSKGSYFFKERNELILEPKNKNVMYYKLKSKGKFRRAGEIRKGDSIPTGWMDLSFKLINFYTADRIAEFTPVKRPTDQTVSAIKVRYKGQEKWMRLNSFLYFFDHDRVYILGYMNRKMSIGSSIKLKRFNIQKYPGSFKAKEYESFVEVDGKKDVVISMNEPLTHKGWTFYQSGFEENEMGQVKASILAVNKDPGRYIKYLGSLLIVVGIFLLFYFRTGRRL